MIRGQRLRRADLSRNRESERGILLFTSVQRTTSYGPSSTWLPKLAEGFDYEIRLGTVLPR